MDILVLIIFVCMLIGCITAGVSIIYALVAGYVLFCTYAFIKGFSLRDIAKMSFDGIKTVKNILITFFLIGVLTALWRAGGTIPAIVCRCVKFMNPYFFVVITFLLCSMVSFLTGTAFGTAATMGTICMTIAQSLALNPALCGGAILSGVYFGDRCSPVSTSALLVSELTKTDISENIKNMIKTAFIPFIITCVIYTVSGFVFTPSFAEMTDIQWLFSREFDISLVTLIPAIAVLIMAAFKVNVKTNLSVSILASVIVCIFVQKIEISDIVRFAIMGYTAKGEDISYIINGGGVASMLTVTAIVCISSCYSGIFRETHLLDSVKTTIGKLTNRFSSYTVIALTSVATSAFACNQTLSIMLTNELTSHTVCDNKSFALYLENSAVVVAPLIPWSIAGSVPLSVVGAPTVSVVFAVFLYLLVIWSMFIFRKNR